LNYPTTNHAQQRVTLADMPNAVTTTPNHHHASERITQSPFLNKYVGPKFMLATLRAAPWRVTMSILHTHY